VNLLPAESRLCICPYFKLLTPSTCGVVETVRYIGDGLGNALSHHTATVFCYAISAASTTYLGASSPRNYFSSHPLFCEPLDPLVHPATPPPGSDSMISPHSRPWGCARKVVSAFFPADLHEKHSIQQAHMFSPGSSLLIDASRGSGI